jgi:hypothetical protein
MKNKEVQMYEIHPEFPKASDRRRWAKHKWMGMVGVSNDGDVFISCRCLGWTPVHGFLMASWEGIPMVAHRKEVMLPVDFLIASAGKDVEAIEVMEKIRDTTLETLKSEPQ